MNAIEHIVSRYRLYQAQCEKRRHEIDREIEQLTKERASIRPIHWTEWLLRPVLQEIVRQTPDIEWEQKEEYHPLRLRSAVLVRGRIKNGPRMQPLRSRNPRGTERHEYLVGLR